MKANSKKIMPLSADIQQVIKSTYGEQLKMTRLCKDHLDPFLHDDKEPILDITQDEFVCIFDSNANHYFLSSDQVFRLATFCKLPLPNTIALLIKAEWEAFYSDIRKKFKILDASLESKSIDSDFMDKCISNFQPDKNSILRLANRIPYVSKNDTSYSHIEFFISDMLEENIFLTENKQVGQLYPENEITEKMLLFKTSESQRAAYVRLKQLWKFKSEELDELLLRLESKKRINLGIENKYFRVFNNIETEKSKWTYCTEKYKIIWEIMQDQPQLSYRDLYRLADNKLTEAEKERNDLKIKIARSLNYMGDVINEGSISYINTDFKNKYMKECKKLLRKIYFLLHSDTCPNYSELSQHRKTEINKLWLELMKSTKEELYSLSPAMLLYSLPNYEHLESIYRRVCEILGINPEFFEMGDRLEFIIKKGTSLKDILEFLKSEIEQLELQLSHLELIQTEYTNEDQSQIYRFALANEKEHSDNLKNEIAELKNSTAQLKKKILNRFKEVVK
jgi:hypothetical protein